MEKSGVSKRDVIAFLQKEVIAMQGHRKAMRGNMPEAFLGPIQQSFPDNTFPIGAVHEFVSYDIEDTAATAGFISGIAGQLMNNKGTSLWIASKQTIFPPALKVFGISPERVIFMELPKAKECLWAIEEALKCKSLTSVIGELQDLTFAESRRLQLAVENSLVTGFIHRIKPRTENPVACVSRWRIRHLSSLPEGLPGVGLPRWHVDLTKVRNGMPGSWNVEWFDKGFQLVKDTALSIRHIHTLKTG